MYPHRDIAKAVLSDGEGSFSIKVLSYGLEDVISASDNWLQVEMEVKTPDGGWKACTSVPIYPEITDLANTAQESSLGHTPDRLVWTGTDPDLEFDFTFDVSDGRVDVGIGCVRSDCAGISEDGHHLRLRLLPQDVGAFAEALERIAAKRPYDLVWQG